jgi:DNA-binding CsgD family transcriptional regulator
MHETALKSEDPWMLMHALAYLSPLETGLGRPGRGLELAGRYLKLADEAGQDAQRAGALWPVATAGAWLGLIDDARAAAMEGVALAERTGHRLYVIGNLTALGTLELSAGDPDAAATALGRAWELARNGDVLSLGRFPLRAGAVEAFAATGELERASAVAGELERVSETLARPWARALSARCTGLLAAARGDLGTAGAAFERALHEHGRQDRPLERARTLLAYGAALRRAQRKAAARDALQSAMAVFEQAGASLWARRAGSELARIGGRKGAGGGELSATEAAITELVVAGRSNREVAGTLHLSVRTIEWNLSKIYRKLGVRSRTELAATGRKSRDSTG